MTDIRLVLKKDIEDILGITGVGTDFIVDEKDSPEAVALFEWSNPRPRVTGGGSWRYVRIDCRSQKMKTARDTIVGLLARLDSGQEEKIFHPEMDGGLIYRPRRGPFVLERTDKTITYAGELSVWANEEDI